MASKLEYTTERPVSYYSYGAIRANGTPGTTFTTPTVVALDSFVNKGENPNWRQDIINNRSATTALTGYKDTWHELSRPSAEAVNPTATGLTSAYARADGFVQPVTPSGVCYGIPASVDNAARTKFMKHYIEEQRQFSTGTFLGEGLQTLRMFRNIGQTLWNRVTKTWKRDAKKHVPRRRRGETLEDWAKRSNRSVANGWLEYTFGITPFVKDMLDLREAINRMEDMRLDANRVTGWASQEWEVTPLSYSNKSTTPFYWRYTDIRIASAYVRYYGNTRVNWARYHSRNMELFGIDWRDMLPTVWEVIPYSFLVDYFSNVGDVLAAWTYGTANMAWISRVERQTLTTRRTSELTTLSAGWQLTYNANGEAVGIRSEVSRSDVSGSSMTPRFQFEVPGLSTRWINIAALADMKLIRYLGKR